MAASFRAVRVTESVWWVGAVDWDIRDFHGYRTSRGSTYNAYLVTADRTTLVDTVKAPFFDEMMARIASVVDPSEIDVIVSNHSEMDHSGSLPRTIAGVGPSQVFASVNGVKALGEHFGLADRVTAVADGGTIDLGNMKLTCLETKMIHWPDSMVSYLGEERVLFSQDGFGMHLASGERFADEIADEVLLEEAARYYANILLPLSPLIEKLLARMKELSLPIDVIAPDHGPIWRRDVTRMPGLYARWAAQQPAAKAVIAFDSMWGSTELMARVIADAVVSGGVEARTVSLRASHRSDLATEILDAGALVVGSPTINNQVFPTMADALTYLEGLKPKNKIGAAFGSYGWSGEAPKKLAGALEGMKVELVAEPVRVKYVPTAEDLAECRALGTRIAEVLKERCPDVGGD